MQASAVALELAILVHPSPEWLGLQACANMPSSFAQLLFG
jgi:hypothetical protein